MYWYTKALPTSSLVHLDLERVDLFPKAMALVYYSTRPFYPPIHHYHTMCDQNTFAILIPCDEKNRARDAFRLPANADWYHKAANGVAETPTIGSRNPTPAQQ